MPYASQKSRRSVRAAALQKRRSALRSRGTALARRRGTARVGRSLGALGFPKMLKVKHRYVGAPVQLNCITGVMDTYVWNANSLYDPDQTGTGHQPMYYDQMSLIYDHYVVIGAKITLKVQAPEEVIGPCIGVLWIDDNTTTTATTISQIAEYGRYPIRNFGGPNSSPNNVFTLKWSAKKTFGGSILANNSLQGEGGNPTEMSHFKFSFNTVDATSAHVYITAILEQVAVWKELKEIAQS